MPSPFPGMDPWLEAPAVFPDLHDSLIFLIREALNAALPDGYLATAARLVWVDPELRREPDVGLFGAGDRPPPGPPPDGPFAAAGAVTLAADPVAEPWEQPYLEVRTADDERLVTAVEVLSRANKTGGDGGRRAYQQKRDEFRLGGVHLVEIDLLRSGGHTTAVRPDRLRAAGEFDYHVCVTVCGDPTRHHVWPIRLADRLPAVPVPLDPGVPPVAVDLQPLVDRAYDTGRYGRRARYSRPPDPPLSADQAGWAAGVLRSKGIPPPSEG